MAKLSLSKQLENTQEALRTVQTNVSNINHSLHGAQTLAAERLKENNNLRDQLMSKTMEVTRLQAILEERDRADRKAADAARPPVMVPLNQHPAYLERHSRHGLDLAAHLSGYGDASDRREWYHRS